VEPVPVERHAEPAWIVEEQCTLREKGRPITSRTPLDNDLDGDGVADSFTHETGSGSWSGGTTVTFNLSTRGSQVFDAAFWFGSMVHTFEAPEALRDLPKARTIVEHITFGTTCKTPDPSLRWLLREPRTVEWIRGAPVIPAFYGWWDDEAHVWHSLAGHMHNASHFSTDYPVVAAVDGEQTLIRTAHGVIVAEPDRYAWLYVHETGPGKLRWPTVADARYVDGAVEVTFNGVNAEDPPPPVRIPLH